MSLKIISPPEELITVADAAEFMRLDDYTDESALISSLIIASRQWCEEYLRRAIGIQTLELSLDQFPLVGSQAIILRPPVISVASVIYLDSDGVEQTLVKDTDYVQAIDTDPGEIRPISSWPTALATANAVKVQFETGYCNDESPILSKILPKTIRTAILMMVADMYNNRESQVERSLMINPTLERLLSTYRLEMGL